MNEQSTAVPGTWGGFCPVHQRAYPCPVCTSAPAYVPTPSTAPSPFIVTTRQVPVPCAVCDKRGWRPTPFEEDNPEDEGQQCDACAGKGWLMVTETTTTRV